MRSIKRKKPSPIEILRKKVGKVVFSDKIEFGKPNLTLKEFEKMAAEVRKTFRNGYPTQLQLSY